MGEVEQSGLPLERGHAYRGYVWATSTALTAREAAQAGDSRAAGGSASDAEAVVSSPHANSHGDGVALVLEVGLELATRDGNSSRHHTNVFLAPTS